MNGFFVATADSQHTDLYRHLAILTLVAHDLLGWVGADELAHKGIVLHADIVDQAVDGAPWR